MINKIAVAAIRIIFIYFLGLNTVAYGVQVVAGNNAPRGARDNVLNVADLLLMERFMLGLETPTADEFKVANVAPLGAPDNIINVADLLVLQRAVLGLVTLPPVNLGPAKPLLNPNTCTVNVNPCAISGTAEVSSTVHIYVNGVEQVSVSANTSGVFTASIALFDGNNSVYAITEKSGGFSLPSSSLTISYVNNLPRTQGGWINANTVWTPGNPNTPYDITGLSVSAGATLTIMPGTILQFGANSYIAARGSRAYGGSLIIRGTPASKVILTSATHTKGAWSGIVIGAGSSVDNAVIEYAYSGITAGGGTISNSLISNNTNGIYVDYGAPHIGPGNVMTANTIGVMARAQDFFSTDPNAFPHPVVTGNQIYNNSSKNYYAENYKDASTVVLDATNNWWGTTSPDAIDKTTLSYTNTNTQWCMPQSPYTCFNTSPLIDFGGYLNGPGGTPVNANHFFNTIPSTITLSPNTTYELINSVTVPAGVILTVPAGVKFDSRGFSARLQVQGSLRVQGTITSPVTFTSTLPQATNERWYGIYVKTAGTAQINYARFEYAQTGVSFAGTVADGGACTTQCVQNSQFINNDRGVSASIAVTIQNNIFQGNSGAGIFTGAGNSLIKTNTLQNNGYGIFVSYTASPIINSGNILTANYYGIYVNSDVGASQPVVNNNSIYGNTLYNYYAVQAASFVLNARNNWWGSTDPATIASTIYDFKNDSYADPKTNSGSPVVDFSGYLQRAGGAAIVENDLAAITSPTTLLSNTTYVVLSGLWVAPGVTLTVQPGAIVLFPKKAKLLVDGSLLVQEGTKPAIFTSRTLTADSWQGIEITRTATSARITGAVIQYANMGVYFKGPITQDLTCTLFCVKNSIIQYNNYGVYLSGAAMPMLTGNIITNNILWGIYLTGSGNDATSPNPVISNNDIYNNYYLGAYYNGHGLYIYNYSSTTGIRINTTGNWWGSASPTQGFGSSGNSDIFISSSATPISVVNYTSAATQVLHTAISPPTVSLTSSGAPYNAPASITLNATATNTNGNITVVDFYNGTTWLGNATSAVGNVYSFTWNNVATGNYILSARATNNVGVATTSAQLPVNVLGDVAPTISITSPANAAVFHAPALIPLSVNANASASNRSITKVSYFNGAILLGETTVAPYSLVLNNLAAGVYAITAKLTDSTGAMTASTPVNITVNSITLTINAAINGTTINDDHMLVSGSFIAPPNSGVTVNGVLATIVPNGASYLFYANNVPLNMGTNFLQATLVSQDGQTATTSASVTSTGSPGFSVIAEEVTGFSPASFAFNYKNTSIRAVSTIQVTVNGVTSTPLLNPGRELRFTYSNLTASVDTAMLFTFTLLGVPDVPGDPLPVLYTTTQTIIITTTAAQDALIKSVFTSLTSRLKQGNVTAALPVLSSQARNTYGSVFNVLMPYMATINSELSNAELISNGSDIASHAILRAENGVNKVYIINSIKDKDGVWRFDSM